MPNTPLEAIEVTQADRDAAGKILPHSLSDETALQYEKRALNAVAKRLSTLRNNPSAVDMREACFGELWATARNLEQYPFESATMAEAGKLAGKELRQTAVRIRALPLSPDPTVGWQPIEAAPKDGSNILIIAKTAYSPEARQGWWDGAGWRFYSRPSKPDGGGLTYMLEATDWQPLPPAPSPEASL